MDIAGRKVALLVLTNRGSRLIPAMVNKCMGCGSFVRLSFLVQACEPVKTRKGCLHILMAVEKDTFHPVIQSVGNEDRAPSLPGYSSCKEAGRTNYSPLIFRLSILKCEIMSEGEEVNKRGRTLPFSEF